MSGRFVSRPRGILAPRLDGRDAVSTGFTSFAIPLPESCPDLPETLAQFTNIGLHPASVNGIAERLAILSDLFAARVRMALARADISAVVPTGGCGPAPDR